MPKVEGEELPVEGEAMAEKAAALVALQAAVGSPVSAGTPIRQPSLCHGSMDIRFRAAALPCRILDRSR